MNAFFTLIGTALIVGSIVLSVLTTAAARHRQGYDDIQSAPKGRNKGKKLISLMAVFGLVSIIFSSSFVIIPTGYTGVSSVFGQISSTPMPQGFNWKIPFVQSVVKVNNKQQDQHYEGQVWSETAEQTVIYMEGVTVTYQINPEKSAWIYANVANYTDNLVSEPLVQSALKTATREIKTEDATNRGVVEPVAKDTVQAALDEKYGEGTVNILKVVIGNMDFEEAYNAAIEQRQIAVLNQEQQAIQNQTNVDKAKAEAEAAREQAQGEADAALIEAQAKAEANRIISESITDRTQRQDAIEKWDGKLPKYVGGEDGASFGILEMAGDNQ